MEKMTYTFVPYKILGNWKEQSNQLKTKFPSLTDEDLILEKGKEEDLLKRMQTRLDLNRAEVIYQINKIIPEDSTTE
ncbi:CsbD family protein [Marinoscillum pacificum]|uniref:CsbD family protein n=1 Tax=Marinoscillum pacificum TaxID=392723 RepID=UPI0021589096|nr:CsbD family protein [Marinoscillum pacificum]